MVMSGEKRTKIIRKYFFKKNVDKRFKALETKLSEAIICFYHRNTDCSYTKVIF